MENIYIRIYQQNRLMRYTIPLILLISTCCSFAACTANNTLLTNAAVDSIVVKKQKRIMYVYQNKQLLKTYKIALGKQPVGHKQYKGDMRTPEGLYYITDKNPNSVCHKNLGISYPNDADRAVAAKMGKQPGGDIKIHGLPNGQGYIGSLHTLTDWTYGCIAITDEEMDELFDHVTPRIPINILP